MSRALWLDVEEYILMLIIIISILSQITGNLFIYPLDIYSHCTCFAPNNRYIKISDGETFISADDLRINLWNLKITNQSFNIVDVKPEKMEDLSGKPWFTVRSVHQATESCVSITSFFVAEVITSAVLKAQFA